MTATLAHDLAERTDPACRSRMLDNFLGFHPADRHFVYCHLEDVQQRDLVRALGDRYGGPLDEALVETIRQGWLSEEAW